MIQILPETFLLESLQKQSNLTLNSNTSAENDSLYDSSTLLAIDDDNYSNTTKDLIRSVQTSETDISSDNSLYSTISNSSGTNTVTTTAQASGETKVKRDLGIFNICK